MPTYRYRRADGSSFEVLQKFSDAPLTHDPESGEPVERVISGGAGLQFKGSGFYLTDYVKKDSGGSGDSASGGLSEAAASDSSAKPASTSAASSKTSAPD